jgi:hypothetical protein
MCVAEDVVRLVKTQSGEPLEIAEELVVLEHVPGGLRMFIRPVMFNQYGLEATKLFTALARMAIVAAIEQDRAENKQNPSRP